MTVQVDEPGRHHEACDVEVSPGAGQGVTDLGDLPPVTATSCTASRPDSGSITRPPRSTMSGSLTGASSATARRISVDAAPASWATPERGRRPSGEEEGGPGSTWSQGIPPEEVPGPADPYRDILARILSGLLAPGKPSA